MRCAPFMYLVRYHEALSRACRNSAQHPLGIHAEDGGSERVIGRCYRTDASGSIRSKSSRCSKRMVFPIVPTVAAGDADDAADKAGPFLAEGLAVAVKLFSRDITHESGYRRRHPRSADPRKCRRGGKDGRWRAPGALARMPACRG